MYMFVCVYMHEKCVYYWLERGDIGQFNLPRCGANLPGLIKFSYKLHNKQTSHVWDQLTPKTHEELI